mgnify:CR=1 FL=1
MGEPAAARPPSREVQESLVREAARAPSVHNVQPARWRFEPEGDLVLLRATDRALPVADPTGHDVMLSLGAAFEGMAIALSRIGCTLGTPVPEVTATAPGCEPVVRAPIVRTIGRDAEIDPLAPCVQLRRSHRGRFAAPRPGEMAALGALAAADAQLVSAADEIWAIGVMHDVATWSFESRPAHHAELWSWLRLSRRDPRYRRDGLNADCLALSAVERRAARLLLRPTSGARRGRRGRARQRVAESAQVRSASAVLLFTPRTADSPFDVGRRFYRLWLSVAATGLSAAPMSASADDPVIRAALARRYGIAPDRRLANLLRIGGTPEAGVPESARLPVGEVLV